MRTHLVDAVARLSQLGRLIRFVLALIATAVLLGLAIIIFLDCFAVEVVAWILSLGL